MKKKIKQRIRYTVEGNGAFPADMLRYDNSWPEHESPDSYNVGLMAYVVPGDDDWLKVRRVNLLTDNPNAPNYKRWESFTWKVVNKEFVV